MMTVAITVTMIIMVEAAYFTLLPLQAATNQKVTMTVEITTTMVIMVETAYPTLSTRIII